MWLALGCLAAGIPWGWCMRHRPRVVRATGRLSLVVIHVLLFLLGAGVGGNTELAARLGDLGVQGVIIGVACALGSALVTALAARGPLRLDAAPPRQERGT